MPDRDRERLEELRARARYEELRSRASGSPAAQPQQGPEGFFQRGARMGYEALETPAMIAGQFSQNPAGGIMSDVIGGARSILRPPGVEETIRPQASPSAMMRQGALMGWGDELAGLGTGAARSALYGTPFSQEREEATRAAREDISVAREAQPVSSFALQAAGAAPYGAAGVGRSLLGSVATGAAASGASAAGEADAGLAERAISGLIGAGVGGVMGPLAAGAIQLGGAAVRGIRGIAQRAAGEAPTPSVLPTVDQLRASRSAAYEAVDNLGARYNPGDVNNLVRSVDRSMRDFGISELRHPRAYSLLQEMRQRIDEPVTLREMDQLRQVIRRDTGSDPAEREAGRRMIAEIDGFLDNATPQVAQGNPAVVGVAMREARQAHRQYRKAELMETAIERAMDRAGSTGVGGNFENVLRQEVRRLYTTRATRDTFTADERRAMQRFVRGSTEENILRGLSRLSPVGNSLSAMLTVGGTMAYGPLGALPLAGMAAQRGAQSARAQAQRELQEQLLLSPEQIARIQAEREAQRGTRGTAGLLGAASAGSATGGFLNE